MSEADRPQDGALIAPPDLRVVSGGARPRRRRRARPRSPSEVAERLTALERRVEEALAANGLEREADERDLMGARPDDALAALATVRRRGIGRVLSALAPPRWRGAAADAERELMAAVLAGLYRYWWRVR